MAKIGVENSLTDVQQALQQQGMKSLQLTRNMTHKDATVAL